MSTIASITRHREKRNPEWVIAYEEEEWSIPLGHVTGCAYVYHKHEPDKWHIANDLDMDQLNCNTCDKEIPDNIRAIQSALNL